MSTGQWLDIIRREALNVAKHGQQKSTVICTSYNPNTHAIKGILVPHGVETGWIPLAAIHIGNGYGVLVGPKVGDPEKLDGDQFDVDFEFGDPNTPIAKHRMFSTPDAPPVVQSGEILLMHQKGAKLYFEEDGSVTLDTNNNPLTINTGSGKLAINGTVDINS